LFLAGLLVVTILAGCNRKGAAEAAAPAGGNDAASPAAAANENDVAAPDRSWWRGAVFQEVYVRSYFDSDGDGIGDFPGLTEKLPYLARLGVGALWLMPMYPTPFFDSGYDVADYEAINPDYGTMDQFQAFLAAAHALGIRVFLDGVFNHTSWDHPWFQESRSSRTNPKRDWYEWADQPLWNCGADPSWGNFGASRWEYDPPTGQSYFHFFMTEQPDLNWKNPAVMTAIEDVLRFWFDLGVDGFRLDAVGAYYEDETVCDNAPQTHAILKEFRKVADEYPDRAFVGEAGGSPDQWPQWFGNGADELHMAFNFNLADALYAAVYVEEPFPITRVMEASWAKLPPGGQQAVFISNHDSYRCYDLLFRDERRVKLAAALELTVPGTPFIYYGEEIGMADAPDIVVDYRDRARAPMQWNGAKNAGFTTGAPWVGVSSNYPTNNVAAEEQNPNSLLNHFRRVIALRNHSDALRFGDYQEVVADAPNAYAFFRTTDRETVLLVFNLSHLAQTFELALAATPWDGATGRVRDLYASAFVADLTAANGGGYPVSLPPFGFAFLKLSRD
jgi:glycosidase